ncbi:MAG TPA: phospholipid carrier-dependent glycosyltransferase, partial [Chloroflexota bacterium]
QVTGRKAMAWLAALVFLTNPNVLYVHTVALTEPVMFACIAAAMYFLVRWTYTGTGQSLVAAGVACGLGVLSRYENWAFAVIAIVLVTLTAYFLSLDGAHSEGVAIAFAAPAVYAMGLWLFYNWLIFGDPLSFQHNQYSAQAFATVGAAPTKGLLALSFKTFGWAAIDTLGWPALSLALAGLLVYFLRTRLRASSLIPYAFVALFFVGVGLLFLGQTIVITPQSDPPSIYNLRYAMVIMPGVAFFIAYLGSSLARLLPAGAVLIVLGLALASQFSAYVPNWPHGVIAVEEGLRGIGSQPASVEVASFMRINYDGGGILVDESSSIFMTRAGLPLKEYVGTFSGQLFNDALRNPEQAVRWVVFPTDTSRDRIGAVLAPSQQFHSRFRLLKSIDGVEIYQRND